MTQNFGVRSIVVTGASSGIGFETAMLFLRSGHRVLACVGPEGLSRPEVEELRLMPNCEVLQVDLAKHHECNDILFPRLDASSPWEGVVNVAGMAMLGPMEGATSERLLAAFQVNALAPMTIAARLLPAMRARRRGLVINVTSGAAICPLPFGGIYAATKAALEAATFALHLEVRNLGVRVFAFRLGKVSGTRLGRVPVEPSISEAYLPVFAQAGEELYGHLWPAGSIWPSPREVADVILRLAIAEQEPGPLVQFGADLACSRALAAKLGLDR